MSKCSFSPSDVSAGVVGSRTSAHGVLRSSLSHPAGRGRTVEGRRDLMRSLPYVLAFSFAFGCGGGGGGGSGALDDLDDSPGGEEDMRVWIESASAPAIYAQA